MKYLVRSVTFALVIASVFFLSSCDLSVSLKFHDSLPTTAYLDSSVQSATVECNNAAGFAPVILNSGTGTASVRNITLWKNASYTVTQNYRGSNGWIVQKINYFTTDGDYNSASLLTKGEAGITFLGSK
jgi:hypothetical protein